MAKFTITLDKTDNSVGLHFSLSGDDIPGRRTTPPPPPRLIALSSSTNSDGDDIQRKRPTPPPPRLEELIALIEKASPQLIQILEKNKKVNGLHYEFESDVTLESKNKKVFNVVKGVRQTDDKTMKLL